MTFSFLLIPESLRHLPKRIVRKIYHKRHHPPHLVIKGSDLTRKEKAYFVRHAAALLENRPAIKCFSFTVNKTFIPPSIQKNPQRFFRQLNRLGLTERIQHADQITFVPNPRSIKTKNGNRLSDDLQTDLWFEANADTVIHTSPKESIRELNLQFVDWLGHIIWKKYEDTDTEAYDMLKQQENVTPWWETLSGW